jgi:hypothetical protein
MPDQPQPDFSQNQQFAPGFQPQMPIPGISSSYQSGQQPFQPQFNYNQSSDYISSNSVNSSKVTMALAQQNLMNSMHTAMLGTLTAFSDMGRRGSNMITAMSPAGRYNDMLAPNQNWALESSFRREAGFGIANMMGLDPHNSVMSRLIQGRRPEFLTEGEYSSTMGYANQLRMSQIAKVGIGFAGSSALSYGAGALGLGLAPALAIPMVGGMVLDRALEAHFAEKEDLVKQQMYVKNKRVGVGQQFIGTGDMAKVHGAFYEQENPYWSRFFGDNALGNAFKPDVQKLKLFTAANEGGLLSNESLDADSLIRQINKISETVEKFSRIGKVTREASVKMMSELKGAGIHGDNLLSSYKQSALTSSLTGIDMDQLVGMKAMSARGGATMGFDTYSAGANYENTLSGFAMMQANGLFKQKDIMRMTQVVNQKNTEGGPQDIVDGILRFGSLENYKAYLVKLGGGNAAVGQLNMNLLNYPVINKVQGAIDQAEKSGKYKTWDTLSQDTLVRSVIGTSQELQLVGREHYLGLDTITKDDRIRQAMRLAGNEPESASIMRMGFMGQTHESTMKLFNRGIRQVDSVDISNASVFVNSTPGLRKEAALIKAKFGNKNFTSLNDFEEVNAYLNTNMKITSDGKFEREDLENKGNRSGFTQDRRQDQLAVLRLGLGKDKVDKLFSLGMSEEEAGTPFSRISQHLEATGINRRTDNEDSRHLIGIITELGSSKLKKLGGVLTDTWNTGNYSNKAKTSATTQTYLADVRKALKNSNIDQNVIDLLDNKTSTVLSALGLSEKSGSAFDRKLFNFIQGKGYTGNEDVLGGIIGAIDSDTYGRNARTQQIEMSRAKEMGDWSVDRLRKAYAPFKSLGGKYIDDNGRLLESSITKDEGGAEVVTKEAKQALYKTLAGLKGDSKAYAEKALDIDDKGLDKIKRNLASGLSLTTEEFNVYSSKLFNMDKGLDDTIRKQYEQNLKDAQDPSGAAIETLNHILTKVYNTMSGHSEANTAKAGGIVEAWDKKKK